jgi:hypothetical protein
MKHRARWGAAILISAMAVFAWPAVAGAQDDPYVSPSPEVEVLEETLVPEAPQVLNEQVEAGAGQAAGAAAGQDAEVLGSTLAFTGGDALGLLAIGAAAVALGAGLMMSRRRASA